MFKESAKTVRNIYAQKVQDRYTQLLKQIIILRQACSHLSLTVGHSLLKTDDKTSFDSYYLSAKLSKLLEMVDNVTTNHEEDKIIILSDSLSLMNIIAHHLSKKDLEFYEINGYVKKRNEIVETFNNPDKTDTKIMLLSLSAGVGLNLIGANRIILIDIQWNKDFDQQASSLVYKVGQKKTLNMINLKIIF